MAARTWCQRRVILRRFQITKDGKLQPIDEKHNETTEIVRDGHVRSTRPLDDAIIERKHLQESSRVQRKKKLGIKGELLFGLSPVTIALEARRRNMHKLFLKRTTNKETNPRIKNVVDLAVDLRVPIEYVDIQILDRVVDGRPHQGVCLDVSRLHFVQLEASDVSDAEDDDRRAIWLFLDEIHDPMNLGAVVRCAYYFNVDRVVTIDKNVCPLTPVVSKASSGAMELLDIYQTNDSVKLLKSMVSRGWCVVGTASVDHLDKNPNQVPKFNLGDFQWPHKTILLVGNEGRGLSPVLLGLCSTFVTVGPGRALHPQMQSLNVGVATGILLQNYSSST